MPASGTGRQGHSSGGAAAPSLFYPASFLTKCSVVRTPENVRRTQT